MWTHRGGIYPLASLRLDEANNASHSSRGMPAPGTIEAESMAARSAIVPCSAGTCGVAWPSMLSLAFFGSTGLWLCAVDCIEITWGATHAT